jgi:hypothetical protein
MSAVKYANSGEAVLLGDVVTTRVFFIRRTAKVVYVPGISAPRKSLEHHGLRWVGLQESTGPFLAALVDPESGVLDKKIKFVERGTPQPIAEDEDPFIEPGEKIED